MGANDIFTILPLSEVIASFSRKMMDGGSLELERLTIHYDDQYADPDFMEEDRDGNPYCPPKYRGAFILDSIQGKVACCTLEHALREAHTRGLV